ncbi:phosphate/phosphite/phosphonate ABC transporter substrate-binding protein [Colwellia sp. BRX8-9]|uniref:phosphate/phosphite/phosphonate ABC transporter substrate-binding protein n=1 Tax=Colwellia sp. BRX8-9 TaxID=2759831 RepID=UPI0015F63DEE|nr:phosphate/phosphite/phosphonate ABC transporter substrate-binding protein [Colwellia sp. BRX8-9]MBA6348125.1 phosphate/phosphite/phosphonate ABC transporter substrate-binding protein [Colwellia sp. BRX8-9]
MRYFKIIKKTLPIFLSFFFTLPSYSYSQQSTDKVYIVGVVPQYAIKVIHSIWLPILKELEKETGLKFKIKGSPNIPAFEKSMHAGEYDFVYMNPYHLVWSQDTQKYVPLVRDHGRQLNGVLVVRKDSSITDVKQLDGKTIAFPSPNALGASLLMRAELNKKHNISITPRYVNSHDSVFLNVVFKQTDAGGAVQRTLSKQQSKIKDQLKVLYRTEKVNPHPFASHPRISKAIADSVQKGLMAISKDENVNKLLSKIPMKNMGLATLDDYDYVKQLGLDEFRVGNYHK